MHVLQPLTWHHWSSEALVGLHRHLHLVHLGVHGSASATTSSAATGGSTTTSATNDWLTWVVQLVLPHHGLPNSVRPRLIGMQRPALLQEANRHQVTAVHTSSTLGRL